MQFGLRHFFSRLAIFIALFVTLSACAAHQDIFTAKSLHAQKGNLDLSGALFDDYRIYKLQGEWEFYWNKLLPPSFFLDQRHLTRPAMYIKVPSIWNQYPLSQKNAISSFGYATYRLVVKLPRKGMSLGLKIQDFGTNVQLWINGTLLVADGKVGKNKEEAKPQYVPREIYFVVDADTLDIVAHVSNFHHFKGGVWRHLYVGSRIAIEKYFRDRFAFEMILLGSLVIMGVYHLGLYWLRRSDHSLLHFGLLTLVIALRISMVGESYLERVLPDMDWAWGLKVEYITFYVALLFGSFFFYYIYPDDFRYKVSVVVMWVSLTFIALTIFLEPYYFTQIVMIFQIFTLVIAGYILIALIRVFLRKRPGTMVMLLGSLVFLATIVNDILYANETVQTGEMVAFGLFVFLLSQSLLLSMRISRAFADSEKLSSELMSLNRLKDEFLANTSHELKTPMMGIIGLAEILFEKKDICSAEESRRILSLIIASGRRLTHLVNDILDMSLIKNNELRLILTRVDLNQVLELVISLMLPLVKGKNLQVRNLLSPYLPMIAGDENRIQQIFHNLLSNAIKFSDHGEIRIEAAVQSGYVRIAVADEGVGIAQEMHEKIFNPFEQVDSSLTRAFGGTGLGLSITRQLVQLHQGKIWVESTPGKGSTFFFTLPLYQEKRGKNSKEDEIIFSEEGRVSGLELVFEELSAAEPDRDRESHSAGRVLVVDDEPINRYLLEQQLHGAGYEVWKAEDAAKAFVLLEQRGLPDLILLDLMMPRMSGIEMARLLRDKHSIHELPILILTARNRSDDLEASFAAGANDYLNKPFDKRELLARVGTLISLKKGIVEHEKYINLRQELDIAQKIQQSILPATAPVFAGLRLSFFYQPMIMVGGDYFDFFKKDEKIFGVFLADVSGHGIAAAMIASMLKVLFVQHHPFGHDPDALLQQMNQYIHTSMENQFITAGYVLVDVSQKKAVYASAGHLPVYIINPRTRKLTSLDSRGRILGWQAELKLKSQQVSLQSGDIIIAYTDGFVEGRNRQREMLGDDGFQQILLSCLDVPVHELPQKIYSKLLQWTGAGVDEPEDDLTLIAMEIV